MGKPIVAYIDRERTVFDQDEMRSGNEIMLDNGNEFHIFQDSEEAGAEARAYWEDMAENNPKEFTCIVGEKALIAWGLGQNYALGNIGVNSLEEWLDLTTTVPEDHFATYDGCEREFKCKHPDFEDFTVAYRSN